MSSEKTKDKRKAEPSYRVVVVNTDMCSPKPYHGSVVAPGISRSMSYDEAWSTVRDDIALRIDEGGWGVNRAHTEVWDSGDESTASTDPNDPVYAVRCRVYNLKEDDACGAEPIGGRLALVYWILLVNDDGTSGDGWIGYEEA